MKQLRQCFFVQVGADHAQAAGIVGAAVADHDLARDIVELEPFAGRVLQDALGAQDPAVFLFVGELAQDGADLILLVALRGFQADVAEYFVGVVLAFAVVMVMVVMLMAVVMVMLMVVMFMFMFMLIIVIVVVIVIVFKRREVQGLAVLDDFQHEVGLHVVPGGGDDAGVRMGLGDQGAALFHALGRNGINIRTIAQGADELAIIVGVENKDYENAIRVLYERFAG